MTGFFRPCSRTRLICSKIFRRRAMLSDSQSSKLSAQSPPCSRNCSPRCALANLSRSASISHDTTSGGRRLNAATVRSNARWSAYLGCWVAGRPCQLAGCQLVNARLLDIAAMLRQNAAPTNIPVEKRAMHKATDTLKALGLRDLNPGAWSGVRGWSEQQSGPLIESINPATGLTLAQE